MTGKQRTRPIGEHWQAQAADLLAKLWSHHKTGVVFIAARRAGTKRWRDIALPLPTRRSRIAAILRRHDRMKWDLYFNPNAFSEPVRRAQYALPTNLAWVDVDDADPDSFAPKPNILWATSPGRHQALWALSDSVSAEEAEKYSRALAYNHGADRNGWSSTKLLRIPFTYNHKPAYNRPKVRLVFDDWSPQQRIPINGPAPVSRRQSPDIDVDPTVNDPLEVFEKYRRKLSMHCRAISRAKRCHEADRSKCIYMLIVGFHEAGASPEEIAAVLWTNAYFLSKHGQDETRINNELSRVLGKLEVSS